ncbi:hypothetical protein [Pedobacter duraquae]|uniref:Uncharacterized protein n=1 Tax=Pedobacter duraquae TaxID=425511 RepID=A0A4R6IRA0_9SPHI|nr:hypothetical protein [Pedobacter duraquae]TDO24919.1 hypothetical protein CLV32_1214 [Pedobacter duraquae]
MKPINAFEIKKSQRLFILNFILLSIFSVFCVSLFFMASDREYFLLEKKVKETEKLSLLRKEINTNFDLILLRFNELSKYHEYNPDEQSKQAIILADIQDANYRVKELIAKQPAASQSFELYEKLNKNVGVMASLQDSLYDSRYSIQNYKEQLAECQRINKAAITRIRGRFGR